MPGASDQTRRVKAVNANWVAGEGGDDGGFEIMLVTEDGERHFIAPSPAAVPSLLALAKVEHVLLWDPTNRTLIAANIVGQWIPPS